MDRERTSAEDLLRRAALDYWFGREGSQASVRNTQAQRIPVNIYDTPDDIVITAPMPGVEADNLDIQIIGSTVTLRASLRGPHQADRQYLLRHPGGHASQIHPSQSGSRPIAKGFRFSREPPGTQRSSHGTGRAGGSAL